MKIVDNVVWGFYRRREYLRSEKRCGNVPDFAFFNETCNNKMVDLP